MSGWFRVVRRRLVSRRSAPVGFASFGAGWFRVVRRRLVSRRSAPCLERKRACWALLAAVRRGPSGGVRETSRRRVNGVGEGRRGTIVWPAGGGGHGAARLR